MEAFQDRLMTKINDVLDRIYKDKNPSPNTQLQIEATIISQDNAREQSVTNKRKFLLETIDIGGWTSAAQGPVTLPNETESCRISKCVELAPQTVNSDWRETIPGSVSAKESTVREARSRRKTVGGLRIGAGPTPPRTPSPPRTRQLATDQRSFPKRRKLEEGYAKLQPSTLDKLIEGIWEQIHKPNVLVVPENISKAFQTSDTPVFLDFAEVTRRCRTLTSVSRTTRSIEVMMQAHWVDCYYTRIDTLKDQCPDLRPHELKKLVMTEACSSFEWSEKDLRNRMAIWKGYREIRDAAGWAALTFAGPGIYRFCKYRMGFDQDAIARLQTLKSRFEVAADTIQPQWRQNLALVGVSPQRVYHGHPHTWVVSKRKDPVPLAWTYRHLPQPFTFEHITTSIIDTNAFDSYDPRRISSGPQFICTLCNNPQSDLPEKNECECFPDLFSPNPPTLPAVQVFSTNDNRNNGLQSLTTIPRGTALAEFIGFITKDLSDVDVMQCSSATGEKYQIYQGQKGNFTRFINHSCAPNCQVQQFVWLGVQRTVVVAKRVVRMGEEVTVDYGERYWERLGKGCACGVGGCRFREG